MTVSPRAPDQTTAALIEPLIVTYDDVGSKYLPDVFLRILVARTVCHWPSVNQVATVPIANPSGRHVHLKEAMFSRYISPVTGVSAENANTTQTGGDKSDSTCEELRTAFNDFFKTPRSRLTNVHNYLI